MNNDQAKLVLGVYRPHGQDAADPFFAEALLQAERDPGIAKWFREEQKFDTGIAAALASMASPPDAKRMIVATMAISANRRRSRLRPLAIAAAVAVLLAVAAFTMRTASVVALPADASLGQLATNLAEHHDSLGLMSRDLARLRGWIAERGGPSPDDLPPGLASLTVLGCQTWNTSHGRVSLLCFMGEGATMVHLYVFENAAGFPELSGASRPRFEDEGGWSLALWQNRGRAYVLGASGGVPAAAFFRS